MANGNALRHSELLWSALPPEYLNCLIRVPVRGTYAGTTWGVNVYLGLYLCKVARLGQLMWVLTTGDVVE